MTDDLISRQAAIDAIDETNWYHQNENKDMVSGANSAEHQPWFKSDDVYSALKSVPSAPRWTPVTERLPEEDTDVLVTGENGEIDIATWKYDSWTEDDVVVWEGNSFSWIDPVAWMPLPEPWKGESDGERKDSDFPS